MKLIEDLVARAAAADQAMGNMATQEEAAEARRQAYQNLERMFEQMAADGYLDENELGDLMAAFRAQGLDTKTLEELVQQLKDGDGTAGVDVTAGLRGSISDQLRDASMRTRDPSFMFQVQMLTQEYHQSFDLASRAQKAEHDIYMTAIRHLVA